MCLPSEVSQFLANVDVCVQIKSVDHNLLSVNQLSDPQTSDFIGMQSTFGVSARNLVQCELKWHTQIKVSKTDECIGLIPIHDIMN